MIQIGECQLGRLIDRRNNYDAFGTIAILRKMSMGKSNQLSAEVQIRQQGCLKYKTALATPFLSHHPIFRMSTSRSAFHGPGRKLVLAFDVGTTYSGISYRYATLQTGVDERYSPMSLIYI